MTSPSSSIVVVDKSGSAEANNLIQTSASQHHLYHHPHQSHQIHAQQVIVNEEYLSADNLNYLKSNDLLNNAQIIQSTASFDFGQRRGEAQLISGKTVHHQQQLHHPKGATSATSIVGHTQDDLYHGATTVLPQTITNPNSKVHVISNVTLVSKSQPPHHQSISFVNSSGKHVHGTHTQQQQQVSSLFYTDQRQPPSPGSLSPASRNPTTASRFFLDRPTGRRGNEIGY